MQHMPKYFLFAKNWYFFLFSGPFDNSMAAARNNLPEQPQQISRQQWDNAAHSYLQPIDLDSLDKTCDRQVYSPFKSGALSITQSEHISLRTNTHETNHVSPKALNWSKENEAIPSMIYHEGTLIYFPSRLLKDLFSYFKIDHKHFCIFNLVTKRRGVRTEYSDKQRAILEKAFSITNYPDDVRRQQLAHELKLEESFIKVWFQNRRAKQRRLRNWSQCSDLPLSEKKFN